MAFQRRLGQNIYAAQAQPHQLWPGRCSKKGMSAADWQKIKIDRQILAIAAVNRATAIYTNDINIIAEAQFPGIPTVRLEDVPLPPLQLNLLGSSPDSDSDAPAAPPSDQL